MSVNNYCYILQNKIMMVVGMRIWVTYVASKNILILEIKDPT